MTGMSKGDLMDRCTELLSALVHETERHVRAMAALEDEANLVIAAASESGDEEVLEIIRRVTAKEVES